MNTQESQLFKLEIRKEVERMIKDKLYLEGLCHSLVNYSCELDTMENLYSVEMTKTMLRKMMEIIKPGVDEMDQCLEYFKKIKESEIEEMYMAVVDERSETKEVELKGDEIPEPQVEHVETASSSGTVCSDDEIPMEEDLDTNINPTTDVMNEPEVEIEDVNVKAHESHMNEYGEDVIKKIGSTLCSDDIDILKKLAEEKKISEDDYYRRTLLISKMGYKSEGDSYYKKCVETLKTCGLISIFESCDKFYVTSKGDIRLTYPTRRECVYMLLQAKRILQNKCSEIRRDVKASVEIMCPRSEIASKMKIKQLGRMYKKAGKIQSYDVVQQKIQGVYVLKLRIFVRGFGCRFYDASKLLGEGTNNFDLEIDILNSRQNNEE